MKTFGRYNSAIREGYGFPYCFTLGYAAALTGATTKLDIITFDSALASTNVAMNPDASVSDRNGIVFRLAQIQFRCEGIGTGQTSGNFTVGLVQAGSFAGTLVSASIAYNASTVYASGVVDARNGAGIGPTFQRGDTLRLDLTAVPAGTLSGGISGMKVLCFGTAFGWNC